MSFVKIARRGVAAGAMLAAMSTASFAQEVTLKMHQFLPAQAAAPKLILDVWADKVEQQSGGKIKIERYPSMQLGGKPPELASQVVDGIADIIWTVTGYTPGRFPRSEAFEMPFIMTNAEDTSRAYWEYAEKNMLDTDFADMKMIGVWVHGPGVIHSKEPITSVEDLNGVKLRAPSRVTNKLFSKLGATPIGMPVPAVPESLSKGVIDAAVIPWEVTSALKVAELVGNHTEFGEDALYSTTFLFAMNKDTYDSMSDELKAVIDANSGADMSAWAGKIMQEADAPARKIAVDRGNTIINLTPEQVAEWKTVAASVEKDWVEEVSTDDFDGKALLEEAKALIAKHSK